ncbi:hypothetical protein EJ05DRAFT_483248 [Pseudovirgaria hyperparasitica]|uniref:Nephrocystin 3-like N-terminal domain-containing protein n=1 Tax=Pseudovirgaria hyperparasitica TaxID=470096 RepID=A0A6A6WFI3_9PEZI|nr:uncharacterized protein EJ05DRAFT_483248 [Pseudovirgaria hyperparasitica]KAF2760804.1 hypothetical protein EJ05DRAFT_483248 [Pseudovirgaria hyperparasitica]
MDEALELCFAEDHDILPDIYVDLFSNFLDSDLFEQWQEIGWHFHCTGGPGCGKVQIITKLVQDYILTFMETTLAAIVSSKLRTKSQNVVASIFITKRVAGYPVSLLRIYFLDMLHSQLLELSTSAVDKGTDRKERIQQYRHSIYEFLDTRKHVFLVIDSIDYCDTISSVVLEEELTMLHDHGLRIFTTSRIPSLFKKEEMEDEKCRVPECIDGLNRFWWRSRASNGSEVYSVCASCKSTDKSYDDLEVFPSQVEYRMDECVTDAKLREYVAWDLNREHGYLGLGLPNEHLPQYQGSRLGQQMQQTEEYTTQLVDHVVESGAFNVAIVKMRLDNLLHATSLEQAMSLPDRLPRNLQTFCDAILKPITTMSDEETKNKICGLLVLEDIVDEDDDIDPGEELLALIRKANGLLAVFPDGTQCCNPVLTRYINDDYDEDLYTIKCNVRNQGAGVTV